MRILRDALASLLILLDIFLDFCYHIYKIKRKALNMKKTLIVVDMQNDFIDMALGTKEAVAIVPKVKAKIDEYIANGYEVIYTRDTHGENYLETPEGKKLPVPHCIKGTKGWEIADGLYREGLRIIDKPNFGWRNWSCESFEDVEMIGLCTDICVVSNALIIKTLFPNANIKVDASCCAGVTPDTHEAALKTMSMCQIDIVGR